MCYVSEGGIKMWTYDNISAHAHSCTSRPRPFVLEATRRNPFDVISCHSGVLTEA